MGEALFIMGMAAAAGYDVAQRRVPNRLTGPLLLAGLVVRGVVAGPAAVGWGAAGAAFALALLIVPFAARWIGGGDVKLAAAAGAWLGPSGAGWTVLVGLMLGGLHALYIAARGGRRLRAEVTQNLMLSLYVRRAPAVPRRARAQLVPLALSLGAAAVGVLWYQGGLHGVTP